ncbi:MAG: hypothetical protein ACJA1E_001732 [Paracoccaceae bacterium]
MVSVVNYSQGAFPLEPKGSTKEKDLYERPLPIKVLTRDGFIKQGLFANSVPAHVTICLATGVLYDGVLFGGVLHGVG